MNTTKKTDREKVIKGLECCVRYMGECEECPYDEGRGNCGCGKQLYADALVLLKLQGPRVMTFEEAKDAYIDEQEAR